MLEKMTTFHKNPGCKGWNCDLDQIPGGCTAYSGVVESECILRKMEDQWKKAQPVLRSRRGLPRC